MTAPGNRYRFFIRQRCSCLHHFRRVSFVLITTGFVQVCSAQSHLENLLRDTVALSARTSNYVMHVSLDPERKRLSGHTALYWKNPSADTVGDLQFHMYYNAFRNNRSTFMRDLYEMPDFTSARWRAECGWGWTRINAIHDDQGNDLKRDMRYIQPDDGNAWDATVLHVPLTDPVLPYATMRIDFEWEAQITKTMLRTGHNKDYYFLAQWFPKVGVYEPAGMRYATEGGWNCHQYHAQGEYYADFGVYEVHLTVPGNFIVGATGYLIDTVRHADMVTWTFVAPDVIDFAWTASPHFVVLTDTWGDVEIALYTYADHAHFAPRYFSAARNAFSYMHEHVGTYPYGKLTIVDPPIHGIFSSGMEYSMLITSLSTCLLPVQFRSVEKLVVHELVHQYFQQMVASHEFEEPWLDEGITSYYEGRIMDHFYGAHTSTMECFGLRIGTLEYRRHEYLSFDNPMITPVVSASDAFTYGGYSAIVYSKSATLLHTLEGLIGRETMDAAMQAYFRQWKFGHPSTQDFADVFNETVITRHPDEWPDGMDWYFDQVLHGTGICDYAVGSIRNTVVPEPAGYFEEGDDCMIPGDSPASNANLYDATVILYRLGEIRLPVDVRITFDDGSAVFERWDGMGRSTDFTYRGHRRIVSAEIDPERKITLDANYLNNSLTLSHQRMDLRRLAVRWLTGMQQLLESLSFLV